MVLDINVLFKACASSFLVPSWRSFLVPSWCSEGSACHPRLVLWVYKAALLYSPSAACFSGKSEYLFIFIAHVGYSSYESLILTLCSSFCVIPFLMCGSSCILAVELWWARILQMPLSSPWFVFSSCQCRSHTEHSSFHVIFINIFLYEFVHFLCVLRNSSLLGTHKDTCLLFFSLRVLKSSLSL